MAETKKIQIDTLPSGLGISPVTDYDLRRWRDAVMRDFSEWRIRA
jgi:hypothetical protein